MTRPIPEQVDDINVIIKERGQTVVDRFRETLTLNITDSKLLAALNYVTGYWSDYFRPALSSFSCEAVGGNSASAITVGMMLTSIDAGVSIHDDILDRTTVKRFRKTVLGAFGLDCAVLVGDLLIVRGWSLIGDVIKATKDPLLTVKLTQAYGNLLTDMCEAQFIEVACRKRLDRDLTFFMEALSKNNAGIKACMGLGAILGGGTETEIVALSNAGKNMALLFALKDELRDTLNLEGYLVHRLKFESVPLPILLAAKSSNERYSELQSIINKTNYSASDIKKTITHCLEANSFQIIKETAYQVATKAKSELNSLSESPAREILCRMVDSGVQELTRITSKC